MEEKKDASDTKNPPVTLKDLADERQKLLEQYIAKNSTQPEQPSPPKSPSTPPESGKIGAKDETSLEDLFFKPIPLAKTKEYDYKIYVTLPPFSAYYDAIVENPFVHSVRFNSATKTGKKEKKVLEFYQDHTPSKDVWVDLKCRQLRVGKDATIPDDYMEITHNIKVKTPVEVIFNDGEASATLVDVIDGYKLQFDKRTEQTSFGQGASLNIMDESFETEDLFTKKDLKYIAAAKKKGIHSYMLSYVEDGKDIDELLKIDPEARIIAKIESMKGLEFVRNSYSKYKDKVRLMAATGDLYVEVEQPHKITYALEEILKADPEAIVASRILSSCKSPEKMPECSEILAVKYLLSLGYKNFMLGDEFCPDRFSLDKYVYTKQSSLPLRAALGLLEAILTEHNATDVKKKYEKIEDKKEMLEEKAYEVKA